MGFPKVRAVTGVLAALAVSASLAACGDQEPVADPSASAAPSSASASPSATPQKITLTLGVYGARPELVAYHRVARAYEKTNPGITVRIRTWRGERAMLADVASGKDVPDLFLSSRTGLPTIVDDKVATPVDNPLDARGVTFGDTYSRQALEDFSAHRRLQCMPYAAEPSVVYYNTDLVDFSKLSQLDIDPPSSTSGEWDMDQFRGALKIATRKHGHGPRPGGVYVDRSVSGLAPWLEAAGGNVFDDPRRPAHLTFSDGDTQDALSELAPLFTNPRFGVTAAQLDGESPVQAFARGRIAMIAGSRDLVPELRRAKKLHWDVMAMPGGNPTTGDYSGLCLSRAGKQKSYAADFLAYLVSAPAVSTVTKAGYTVPANQAVAYGNAFINKHKPHNSLVYVRAIESMDAMPADEAMTSIDRATRAEVRGLFGRGHNARLEKLTGRIDKTANKILVPPAVKPAAENSSTASSSSSPTSSSTSSPTS